MANVLTNLALDIQKAADEVGRELVGAIPSVLINADGSDRVAVGDVVRSHFTRQPSASVAITPSMTVPEGTDQTVDNKTATISKAQGIQIPWTGEDVRHVDNGIGFGTIYGDQIKQAMRTLTNEIEIDLLTEIYCNASRAIGTAGTTPFASNFNEVAQIRQILVDNGCAMGDTTLIVNSLAGTNLRNLAQLQKANEAGGTQLLRQGTLLDLQEIMLKESAGIRSHTKGTGAGYLVNNTGGLAVGTTTIPVDTGTGTVLAGDIVTFAGDTVNKYVVTGALSGGAFTIGGPGLRVAIADNAAVTVGNNYTANVALRRNAAELIIRPPAVPSINGVNRDAAIDAMTVQDPHSGLVFEVRAYVGFRKAMFEISAAWGVKAWKPENIALLLG